MPHDTRDVIDELFNILSSWVSLSIFGSIMVLSLLQLVKRWLSRLRVKTLFIERGNNPRENGGDIESFNGKLRDELLDWEMFTTVEVAKVMIEQLRRGYNQLSFNESVLTLVRLSINRVGCRYSVGKRGKALI